MSLEIQNIRVERDSFTLTADFKVKDGQIIALLGPSGCGKTTLLRAIAGLEHLKGGAILLDGERIDELPPEHRHIGFVFQDLALFEQMSVRENIGYSLAVRKERKASIEQKI